MYSIDPSISSGPLPAEPSRLLRRDSRLGPICAGSSTGFELEPSEPRFIHGPGGISNCKDTGYVIVIIIIRVMSNIYNYTSSTAQGGGRSFKNRKPIGEVGCCESRMAERSHWWIERWLMSPLFLSLFLSFSDYLPTYLPTYLPSYRSIYLSMLQNPHVLLTFEKVHNPLRLPRETTSEPPKVARTCGVLYMLTSKCASRHNGVQFFISHLARWLRTRCFSEPTFRPSGAANQWKSALFRDFPTVSRICIFFLLTLSLLWSSLFYSSLLSGSSHLCFSSVHIVGSLTSKLPSMIIIRTHRWDIVTLTSQLQSEMWIENTCNVATKTGCEHQWFAQRGHMTLQLWPFTSYKYEY